MSHKHKSHRFFQPASSTKDVLLLEIQEQIRLAHEELVYITKAGASAADVSLQQDTIKRLEEGRDRLLGSSAQTTRMTNP